MASVRVVGQQQPVPGPHSRLDSEPPVLLFKLSGTRTKISLPRTSSWDKMMCARSCEDFEPRPPPPPSGGAAGGGGGRMPGGGCCAPATGSDAPRSPTQEDDGGGGTGSPRGRANQDTGSRRGGSLKESGLHRHHRDSRLGRRSPQSASSSPGEYSGGLPGLERLTQGRTGVVKLARTEPHRIEAWSIFPPQEIMDPRVRTERGEGHRFETQPVNQDWCDVCSREIFARVVKCQNCSYSCHLECAAHIQLDCNQRDRKPQESPHPRSQCSSAPPRYKQSKTKEEEEGSTKNLSEEEVRAKIEDYNTQVSENGMKLAADGSYTGFIKVHLRLSRPVTVPAVNAPSSEGNHNPSEDQDDTDCGYAEKRTSFYLPCDCVKQLHISSLTTTREVIQGLLKKFMVLDNPRKFALYRQTHRDGQDLFQKLPLSERPLLLRLIAGPDTEQLTFVLKENETGEVQWHAFSVPELQNFLVILEKEEAERVRAVQQKYTIYKRKLQQALQQHDP